MLLCISFFVSTAYGSTYVFKGHIHDIFTSEPISGFPVFINIDDLLENVVTDSNGFYTFTYTSETSLQYATVIIDACYGDLLHAFFEPPADTNVANFETCFMPDICQASFYYEIDIEIPLIISFFDDSFGESISKWTWIFGDADSSDEINPIHEYAEPGIYLVVLVVEDTAGVCWSAYDEFVEVSEINDCEANFEYTVDDLSVQLIDLSIGSISFWDWDFGDGNWSGLQNPDHTYSEPGGYNICLTVSDSMFNCFDTYCTYVFIGDTISCEANFEVVLDTLNPVPHTFIFTDSSTGDIYNWLWDFGDGSFSQEQNPVHTYMDGGDYEVCLSIFSDQGDIQCADEFCADISTLQYYNFGGHAFIGDFPINIEEHDSSNIATAYLYRRFNNQWKYMDAREFWRFGYYWFVKKPEGEYLIRIDLNENSVDYDFYAPSYFENSTDWRYASTVILNSDDQFAIDVNFKELTEKASGIGVIGGYLEVAIGCESDISISNQIVKLFNNKNQYIAFDYTDDNGEFEFQSLGNGSYKLQGEVTGNTSTFEFVELSAALPFSDDNVLVIDCNSFVGIEELSLSSENIIVKGVYPIPASDFVRFKIQSVSYQNIEIEIIDQIGRNIKSHLFNISNGETLIEINVSQLQRGLYIYRIKSSEGQILNTGKIIVRK